MFRRDRQARVRRSAIAQPQIEALETRNLLSTFTYTGAADGSWFTGLNWDLDTVPTAADFVVVPSGKTVAIPTGTTVTENNPITGAGTIDLTGTLLNTTVGGTLTVQGKGGTLDGDDVISTAKVKVAGGSMYNYDVLKVQNGLQLDGVMQIGNSTAGGYVQVLNTETLSGSGEIDYTAASYTDFSQITMPNANTTLTVGSQMSIIAKVGSHATLGGGANSAIVNDGVIEALGNPATGNGADLNMAGTLTNSTSGVFESLDGGQWTMSGNIVNNGSFTIDSGVVARVDSFTQSSTGTLAVEIWKASPLNPSNLPLMSTSASTIDGNVRVYESGISTDLTGQQFWMLHANAGSLNGSFAGAIGATLTEKPNATTGPNVWATITTQPVVQPQLPTATFVAYRPVTPDINYLDYPIPLSEQESQGVGIRIDSLDNQHASLPAGRIDPDLLLLNVSVGGDAPAGFSFALQTSTPDLQIWGDESRQTPILVGSQESSVSSDSLSHSLWVEWTGPQQGSGTLSLILTNGTGQTYTLGSVNFHTFASDVVLFTGETNHDEHVVSGPIKIIGTYLYQQGYDVHLFIPSEDHYLRGGGPPVDEVKDALTYRAVSQLAILGYSHGGGAAFHLTQAIKKQRITPTYGVLTIPFIGYVDAIQNLAAIDFLPLIQRPAILYSYTEFLNIYETNTPIIHGVPFKRAVNINLTKEHLTHTTILNPPNVQELVEDSLILKMTI